MPFSWYTRIEGYVKQYIKESCGFGGRRLTEIYAVVFIVIVTISFVFLIDIFTGGKDIVKCLKRLTHGCVDVETVCS